MQNTASWPKVIIAHWSTRPRAAALSSYTWEESARQREEQQASRSRVATPHGIRACWKKKKMDDFFFFTCHIQLCSIQCGKNWFSAFNPSLRSSGQPPSGALGPTLTPSQCCVQVHQQGNYKYMLLKVEENMQPFPLFPETRATSSNQTQDLSSCEAKKC